MPLRGRLLGIAMSVAALSTLAGSAGATPSKQECVGANERGQALRLEHHLRAARKELVSCDVAACPGPVSDDCASRVAEIDRVMPVLFLAIVDADGHELTGASVVVDGEPIAASLDREPAVELDPGNHRIEVRARDHAPWSVTVDVTEGETRRRVEAKLLSLAADPGRPRRMAGLALASVGGVSVIVGGVLGVIAKTTYDAAVAGHCRGVIQACDGAGVSQVNLAHGQAAAATGAVIGGAALLAGGVALWVTARAQVRVASTGGGARVGAEWTF